MERNKNQFHMTVGAGFSFASNKTPKNLSERIDLSRDLNLIKAALLYSDKVNFFSCGPSAILSLTNRPRNMNEDEQIEWFFEFYKNLGIPSQIEYVSNFLQEYKKARQNKNNNLNNYMEYKQALAKSYRDMDIIATNAGIKGLKDALDSGLVDFQNFALIENSVEAYITSITQAINSDETYTVLDEQTSEIINLGIKEGIFSILGKSKNRATQVGISSELIERLPLFDAATIDEILDIRKELDKPLIRFRSAIIDYSKNIETQPWNDSFQQETEELYIRDIAPAILEIEDAYKSNKSLFALIPKIITQGVVTTTALGICLSQSKMAADSIFGLSISGGLSISAYEAIKQRRIGIKEVEKHQLFFYYKAANMLSGK